MEHYYHGTLRNYVIAFGSLFKEIYIKRYDSNDQAVKTIRVPLTYAEKRKFYMEEVQGKGRNEVRPIGILLPRIIFLMSGLSDDRERKTNTMNKFGYQHPTNPNKLKTMRNPIPYDFDFSVSIWTINTDESLQIIEQILPLFQPYYNLTINTVPDMGITTDIPIELTGVNKSFEFDMDNAAQSQDIVMWELTFTMRGLLFPRISDAEVIKTVITTFRSYQDDPYSSEVDLTSWVSKDIEEVFPLDSEFADDWQVKRTRSENGGTTTVTYHDKPDRR